MLLTIIIPHFNSPTTLRRLLLSIPLQDNIQVLVIDDYSTLFLEEYDRLKREFEKKVEFLSNTSNKSAGTCRNIGMSYAKGRWVVFADADDFFVEYFHEMIQNDLNLDASLIVYKPISLNIVSGDISNRHVRYSDLIEDYLDYNNWLNELKLRSKFFVPWSKVYNRSFLQKNNIFFDETPVSNDVMFSVKSGIFAEKVVVSDKTIYCVTESENTLTKLKSKNVFVVRRMVFIKYANFLRKNLSKSDYNLLNISGFFLLKFIFNNKLPKYLIITTGTLFLKNQIKFIPWSGIKRVLLNISVILKKT